MLCVQHFLSGMLLLAVNDSKKKLLGSKILGSKYIRTNHDQNIESRFKLLKVCLFVKLESSDCRIYLTKSARHD